MTPIEPSELLSHATWLRRLARTLVREDADDVVQDTWLAALRRPPEVRADRDARPWLRTVLANMVRLRRRGDANRNAREQIVATAGAGETAPSTAQLLERHELQQLLARLVTELDEPFRSTILLRFGEDLAPAQIARRLGVPAGTVRWRLKEALARLRARLDARHRDDRRAWIIALAPLARPRGSAAAPAFALALALAVALVAAGAVAWSAFGRSPATARAGAASSAANRVQVRASATPPAVAFAWLAQPGVASRALAGHVVIGGHPAAGAHVRLLAEPLPPRELVADANGRFDFGEQPPRELVLGASMPGTLAAVRQLDLRDPDAPREVELVLDDCVASLYGTVTDAAGTPIAHAAIEREGVIGAETDASGRYELCTLPTAALVAEIRIVVRASGYGTLVVALAPAGRVRHDIALAPEATVTGRVLGDDGAPITNARVAIDLTAPEVSAPPERPVTLFAASDADGRFRIAGLAAGDYRVSAVSARAAAAPVSIALAAGDNRDVDLRAAATGTVRGRVLADGRPVGGATVATGGASARSQPDGSFVLERVPAGDVELATPPYRRTSGAIHVVAGADNHADIAVEALAVLRGTVRRHGAPVPFARVDIGGPTKAGVTADADGRYEARGLAPGKYGFYCDDRRLGAMFAEDRDVELGAGETREHDIELAWGATITGRVVDGRGEPVAGAEVHFTARIGSRCATDASGAFRCGGLAGDTYTAAVYPVTGAPYPFRFAEPPSTIVLADGDARVDHVRLVVDPALLAIAGSVVDGAGAPVADVAVRAVDTEHSRSGSFRARPTAITDGDGRFRIADLSPGTYVLETEAGDRAGRTTAAAGATEVALVLARSHCDAAHVRDVPPGLVHAPSRVVWGDQIELVGWSLPPSVHAGAPIELVLVYRALRPIDRAWTVFAHFDSPAQRVNADHEPALGWCPTSQWAAGETIVDRVTVHVDRAGRYALAIGLFTGTAPDWIDLPLTDVPAALAAKHGVHVGDITVD